MELAILDHAATEKKTLKVDHSLKVKRYLGCFQHEGQNKLVFRTPQDITFFCSKSEANEMKEIIKDNEPAIRVIDQGLSSLKEYEEAPINA